MVYAIVTIVIVAKLVADIFVCISQQETIKKIKIKYRIKKGIQRPITLHFTSHIIIFNKFNYLRYYNLNAWVTLVLARQICKN